MISRAEVARAYRVAFSPKIADRPNHVLRLLLQVPPHDPDTLTVYGKPKN